MEGIHEKKATPTVAVAAEFPKSAEDLKTRAAENSSGTLEENFQTRVFPSFFAELTNQTEPCFAVLDFRYVTGDRKRNNLIFIGWCPEKTKIKPKMLFSSTLKQLGDKLGVAKRHEAHEESDVDYATLFLKCSGQKLQQ